MTPVRTLVSASGSSRPGTSAGGTGAGAWTAAASTPAGPVPPLTPVPGSTLGGPGGFLAFGQPTLIPSARRRPDAGGASSFAFLPQIGSTAEGMAPWSASLPQGRGDALLGSGSVASLGAETAELVADGKVKVEGTLATLRSEWQRPRSVTDRRRKPHPFLRALDRRARDPEGAGLGDWFAAGDDA